MFMYAGSVVSTAKDVDEVTDTRIKGYTRGVNNEMKMHRKALWALSVLAFPQEHRASKIAEAQKVAERAAKFHEMVEFIVGEGKAFKQANGLI